MLCSFSALFFGQKETRGFEPMKKVEEPNGNWKQKKGDVPQFSPFEGEKNIIVARPRRFERLTPTFGGLYSIQLSYERVMLFRAGLL